MDSRCRFSVAIALFGFLMFRGGVPALAVAQPEDLYLFARFWCRGNAGPAESDFFPPDLICVLEGRCSLFSPTVWFVDNSAPPGGDGTLDNPFDSLASVNGPGGSGDVDGPGHIIFVFAGSGPYDGGIALEANQQLIGEGEGLALGPVAIPPGDRPVLTNTGGDGIALSDGTMVTGLDVAGTSGSGIVGVGVSASTVGDVTVSQVGNHGVLIENGTVEFGSTKIENVGGTGLKISGASSTVTLTSIGIDGTGGVGIDVSGARVALAVLQGGDVRNTAGFPLDFSSSAIDINMPDVSLTGPGIYGEATGGSDGGPGRVLLGNVTVRNSPGAGVGFAKSDLEVTFNSLDVDGADGAGIGGSSARLAITLKQPGGAIRNTSGRSLDFDSSGVTANLPGMALEGPGITAAKAGLDLTVGDVSVLSVPGPGLDFSRAGVNVSMNSLNIDGATAEGILADKAGFELSVAQPGGVIRNTVGRSLSLDSAYVDFNFNGGTIIGGGIEARATGGTLDLTGTALTVNEASGHGINLQASGLGFLVERVTIANASGDGINLDGYRGTFHAEDLVKIANPGGAGIQSESPIRPATGTITLASLEIENAAESGIRIEHYVGTFTVNDATIDGIGAGYAGIDINDASGATFTFKGVNIDNTGGDGIRLNDAGTVSILGGDVDNTTGDGINSTNTDLVVEWTNVGVSGVIGGDGIEVTNSDGRTHDVVVENNNVFGLLPVPPITGRGVFLNAQNGTLSAALTTNSIDSHQSAIATQDGGSVESLVLAMSGNSTLMTHSTGVPTMELVGTGLHSTIVTTWDWPNQVIGRVAGVRC